MLVRLDLTRFGQLPGQRGLNLQKTGHKEFGNAFLQSHFPSNSFRGLHNYSVPLSTTFGATKVQAGPEFIKKSFSPLLSRNSYFPANTNVSSRGFGFVKMTTQPSSGSFGQRNQASLGDNFFQITQQDTTVLQFTDLQYYLNPTREDKEGVNIVRTIAQRVKPNLVVFTGDIIDSRYCKDYKVFRNAIQPLVELQIPWTYIPGKPKFFPRKELLNLFSLPFCASRGATSFTHTLKVGLSQIHMVDTYGEPEYSLPSSGKIDAIPFEPETDWFAQKPAEGQVSLAFYHNCASKKPKLPKGRQETFSYNSGFVSADQDLQGLFTGLNRWNDFVVSETEGVWLCYGQVKSGFTQSERHTPLKKDRCGRVIRYDPSSKLLSTWMETKKGVEHNSIISRRTVAADTVPLHDE